MSYLTLTNNQILYSNESRDSHLRPRNPAKLLRIPTEESEKRDKIPPAPFKVTVLQNVQAPTTSATSKPGSTVTSDTDNEKKAKAVKNVIIFPKTLPKQPDMNSPFISFNSLLQTSKQALPQFNDKPLRGSLTDRECLTQRLDFNKKQAREFRKTAKEEFIKSYRNLVGMMEGQERKQRKMPPIRVYSKKDQLQPILDFAKDLIDSPENKKEDTLLAIKNKVFRGPNKSYNCFWYPPPEGENYVPEAREGATLLVHHNIGYLYGGVSQDLHSEMLILDSSNRI